MKCDDCHVELTGLARVVGKVVRHNGIVVKNAGVYCCKCGGIRKGERRPNGQLIRQEA